VDDDTWQDIEFGLHHHDHLVRHAGARPLHPAEDAHFIGTVRNLLIRHTSTIDWNRHFHDVHRIDLRARSQSCDDLFVAALERLDVDDDELIWAGWHDQDPTIEICKAKLLEHRFPALFVGRGMVMMNARADWLVEYKFGEFICAGALR